MQEIPNRSLKHTDANRISSGYKLKDELARYCLPEANRNPDRKFAWMNSICILFLLVGILGAKSGSISTKPVPPVEEATPVALEPIAPPPQPEPQQENQQQTEEQKQEAPQVVVVVPNAPNITFAVPTIGNLVAPSSLAQAPPLRPMQPPTALRSIPSTLTTTGTGGDRPQPPYPRIALDQGEQGSVTLLLTADEAGNIVSVEIKKSSGFPVLDHGTAEYVKRHWTVAPGAANRLFEATITYQLQAG